MMKEYSIVGSFYLGASLCFHLTVESESEAKEILRALFTAQEGTGTAFLVEGHVSPVAPQRAVDILGWIDAQVRMGSTTASLLTYLARFRVPASLRWTASSDRNPVKSGVYLRRTATCSKIFSYYDANRKAWLMGFSTPELAEEQACRYLEEPNPVKQEHVFLSAQQECEWAEVSKELALAI